MAFSGYKNQRRRIGKKKKDGITEKPLEKHRTGERIEKKLSFLCFFSKKQRRPRAAEEESN
jgi:hypothetical protein